MPEAVETVEPLAPLLAELAELRSRVTALEGEAGTRREVLDIDGAAAFLKVSEKTIRRRVKERCIPHHRIGGDKGLRFIRADLLKWLRAGCPRQGTPRLHSRPHAPSRPATGTRA
ncbi:MAG: helix-turn-helix domain-containing protein [Planctomycetota bacterium]